ncbi:uncharacterized protein LOC143017797 isoform X2 [Oratosquilla oratoria]
MVAHNVALKKEEWYKDVKACHCNKSALVVRATREKYVFENEEARTDVIYKLVFGSAAFLVFMPKEELDEGEIEAVRTHFIKQFQDKVQEHRGFNKFHLRFYAGADFKICYSFKKAIISMKEAIIKTPQYCISAFYHSDINKVNACSQHIVRMSCAADVSMMSENYCTGISTKNFQDGKSNQDERRVSCLHGSEKSHTFPQGVQSEKSQKLQPLITESQDALGIERRYYDSIEPGVKPFNILVFGPNSYAKMCFINLVANFSRYSNSKNSSFWYVLEEGLMEGSLHQPNGFTTFSFVFRLDSQMKAINIISSPALKDTAEAIERTIALKDFITELARRKFPLHAVALVVPAQSKELPPSVQEILDFLTNVFSPGVYHNILTFIACSELYHDLSPVMTASCLQRLVRKQCFKFSDMNISQLSSGGDVKHLLKRYQKTGEAVWKGFTQFLTEATPLRVDAIWSSLRKMYSLHAHEESLHKLEMEIIAFMEMCKTPSSEGLQHGRRNVWSSAQTHFQIVEAMEPSRFQDVYSLLQWVVENMQEYSEEDKHQCLGNLIAGHPVNLHKIVAESIADLHEKTVNLFHDFQETETLIANRNGENLQKNYPRYFRRLCQSLEKNMYFTTLQRITSLIKSVQGNKHESVEDKSCSSVSVTECLQVLKEEVKPEHKYYMNCMISYLEKKDV